MLEVLILILLCVSIVFGIGNNNLNQVSSAAIDSCTKAIELVIYLSGSMAFWGGIMRIADESGLTSKFAKAISPVTRWLFKGIEHTPKAEKAVTMNIVANFFGLGNAATPLGISAVRELNKDRSPIGKRNIAMFVVLNTSSIQLIPTTVGSMRLAHGAATPFDVTPSILITSLISALTGCIMVYVLYISKRKKI